MCEGACSSKRLLLNCPGKQGNSYPDLHTLRQGRSATREQGASYAP
jgi:hypothetical protein